jgi:alpha-beta hydrolase superfamily lysophospholipase
MSSRAIAAGVPVILLHGITDSWRSFEPVLPHLPASIRAFALSQRGHGDSERPAAGYHPRDFAADGDVLQLPGQSCRRPRGETRSKDYGKMIIRSNSAGSKRPR